MSYVVRNQYGAFCSVCQSPLGLEEDDWDTCDACGGEGFGEEDDFAGYDPDDDGIEPTYVSRPAPPELRKVLADALAAPPPDPQPPGAEMTTIDDEVLARLRHQAHGTAEAMIGRIAGVWARQSDLRTLLSSYDEMKGRIEEAERLLAPVPGWLAADSNALGRSDDDPFTVKTRWFRALASFVSREKVDGGARG